MYIQQQSLCYMDINKVWYIIHTQDKCELKTFEQLRTLGVICIIPTKEVVIDNKEHNMIIHNKMLMAKLADYEKELIKKIPFIINISPLPEELLTSINE